MRLEHPARILEVLEVEAVQIDDRVAAENEPHRLELRGPSSIDMARTWEERRGAPSSDGAHTWANAADSREGAAFGGRPGRPWREPRRLGGDARAGPRSAGGLNGRAAERQGSEEDADGQDDDDRVSQVPAVSDGTEGGEACNEPGGELHAVGAPARCDHVTTTTERP